MIVRKRPRWRQRGRILQTYYPEYMIQTEAAELGRGDATPRGGCPRGGGIHPVQFGGERGMGASGTTLFCEVKCLYLADDDRDIDVYHWSSAKFSSTWHDTFSILLARGRAQVSAAASRGDWPKRTQDQAYSDQNHASAA